MRSATGLHWKKVFLMGISLFRPGFNPSKCKTMAKMAVARVKLLRNKREVVIKQMRRDIAMLLESGQDATARIRIEHVIREQNVMAANDLIEIFCELVVARLSVIAKQRECPTDLKEGISSLIFAAPRCSDIPELLSITNIFQKKYGNDFVSAATDLRPNAGVNRMLIDKLSVKTPSGEIKMKVLKEIAKEFQVQWDTKESEEELLKPPEGRIEGPDKFLSASSMPFKPVQKQYSEPIKAPDRVQNTNNNNSIMNFQELASVAGVAAEKALAAAEAAAALAAASNPSAGVIYNNNNNNDGDTYQPEYPRGNSHRRMETKKMMRRQSYDCPRAAPPLHTDIKFDESDCDEEIEMEESPPSFNDSHKIARRHSYNSVTPPPESDEHQPPDRPAPLVPGRRVHPKLPDYDVLAARFEALKHHNGHN